jgi:hypothetical protein
MVDSRLYEPVESIFRAESKLKEPAETNFVVDYKEPAEYSKLTLNCKHLVHQSPRLILDFTICCLHLQVRLQNIGRFNPEVVISMFFDERL